MRLPSPFAAYGRSVQRRWIETVSNVEITYLTGIYHIVLRPAERI